MSFLRDNPKPDTRGAILEYFKRHLHRPVLIGQIALALKCSLVDAEAGIQALVDGGEVREVTPKEAERFGINYGLTTSFVLSEA